MFLGPCVCGCGAEPIDARPRFSKDPPVRSLRWMPERELLASVGRLAAVDDAPVRFGAADELGAADEPTRSPSGSLAVRLVPEVPLVRGCSRTGEFSEAAKSAGVFAAGSEVGPMWAAEGTLLIADASPTSGRVGPGSDDEADGAVRSGELSSRSRRSIPAGGGVFSAGALASDAISR